MTIRRTNPLTTEEILNIIQRNQTIADAALFQEDVADFISGPVHIQQQQAKMNQHWVFLELLVEKDAELSSLLAVAQQELTKDAAVASNEALLRFFTALFVAEDLWNRWIAYLDGLAAEASRAQLALLDQAPVLGLTARKRLVVVGGGPLTTLLVSVFSPYFDITLITQERRLGNQWRTRKMHLNSSCTIRSADGTPLPLLDGPTTRILGRAFRAIQLGLDVDVLALRDALPVVCEVGNAIYPSGPLLGELIAHNLHMHVDAFLIGQRVDISQTSRNADGSLRLVLQDVDDGTQRQLDAEAVFILTGPGPEVPRVGDATTNRVYRDAAEHLDAMLGQIRQRLANERKLLSLYAERFPNVLDLCPAVEREVATCQARYLQANLPLIWTLTGIQKVYALWQELEALNVPADAFPLAPLFNADLSVGYIGAGDTMRTLKECMDGFGPASAYPRGLYPQGHRRSTIYNLGASSAEAYQAVTRRRYWDVYTDRTRAIPFKASGYRLVNDSRKGRRQVEVIHADEQGKKRRRRYDYLFDATGLDRSPIEEKLPPTIQLQTIFDLQGKPVARGDKEGRIFIVGSATGTLAPDFTDEIRAILEALGISQNTIALWVKGVDVERLAYTFLIICLSTLAQRSRN